MGLCFLVPRGKIGFQNCRDWEATLNWHRQGRYDCHMAMSWHGKWGPGRQESETEANRSYSSLEQDMAVGNQWGCCLTFTFKSDKEQMSQRLMSTITVEDHNPSPNPQTCIWNLRPRSNHLRGRKCPAMPQQAYKIVILSTYPSKWPMVIYLSYCTLQEWKYSDLLMTTDYKVWTVTTRRPKTQSWPPLVK